MKNAIIITKQQYTGKQTGFYTTKNHGFFHTQKNARILLHESEDILS